MNWITHGIFLALCLHSSADAAQLRIITREDLPPYIEQQGSAGALPNMIAQVYHREGLSISSYAATDRRISTALKRQKVDASLTFDAPTEQVFATLPLAELKPVAIAHPDSDVVVNQIADLTHWRTLTWVNAHQHLGTEFNRYFSPVALQEHAASYIEMNGRIQRVRMFWNHRTDVLICDWPSFAADSRNLGIHESRIAKVKRYDIGLGATTIRLYFNDIALRNQFNEAFIQYRQAQGELLQ